MINYIKKKYREFRNSLSFDGANSHPARSSFVSFPMDSRREVNPYERREIVKKHRSIRNNLGFARGIVNSTVELAIGWGLQPMPRSGNRDFDRRAVAYWKRQTNRKMWNVRGKENQAMIQRLILKEAQTDGEIFALKIRDQFGNPQRQLFKTEQLGNHGKESAADNWVDGIRLNALERPVSYRFLQADLPGKAAGWGDRRYTDRAAKEVLHIFERERAVQTRGLPWGYCGINDLVDALDTIAFEKIAHKLNAAIIGSIKSPDGTMPASIQNLVDETAAPVTQGDKGESVKFLDIYGSQIPLFKEGEGFQFFHQGRSVINVQEFVALLFNMYAMGYGLPVDWLWGMSKLGGAVVRGTNEMAGRFAERVQMMMIDDLCQPDWEDVVGTGIMASRYPRDFPGVEPLEPPPGYTGWNVTEWRGPRNITVDKGRDGRLYLELMQAGKMTNEEWWTLNGEDPEEMDDKSANEVAERLERWRAHGLPDAPFWQRELGNSNSPTFTLEGQQIAQV